MKRYRLTLTEKQLKFLQLLLYHTYDNLHISDEIVAKIGEPMVDETERVFIDLERLGVHYLGDVVGDKSIYITDE